MNSSKTSINGTKITGVQKAAILMLALGAEHAGRLFTMMHEDEIVCSRPHAQLGRSL